MMMDEEGADEADKGTLAYQEQKVFNSEPHLISVYDHTVKRFVTFEVYGLDTQGMLTLKYDYQAFDNLFRFNAELMNPNRKEGRFHWVIERLEIQTLMKGDRKLKLGEKPTEEISQLPIYETVRKIPTGRMDLKERQRYRERMDMLDIRREENIAKKRAATKERFLKHVFALKEEDARRKEEQQQKIDEERANRYKQKEDTEKKEEEELRQLEQRNKLRRKAVEVRSQRTEEQEEYELAQLRLRWKAHDAEKARLIQASRDRRAQLYKEAEAAEKADEAKKADAQERRQTVWKSLADRRRRKEDDWLKMIFEQKADRKRHEKMKVERAQEHLKEWGRERWPIFRLQLERTEERRLAREAEEEAVKNYHSQRAIQQKPNLKAVPKGDRAKKTEEQEGPKSADTKKAPKKKDDTKKKKEESGVEHVEKVLDAVETKMRAEMEEEKRRQKLDKVRQEKIAKKEKARIENELKHLTEVRENYRRETAEKERVAAQRHLIMQEKSEEQRKNTERKKQEAERLQRIRDTNIERREQQRLAQIFGT